MLPITDEQTSLTTCYRWYAAGWLPYRLQATAVA